MNVVGRRDKFLMCVIGKRMKNDMDIFIYKMNYLKFFWWLMCIEKNINFKCLLYSVNWFRD